MNKGWIKLISHLICILLGVVLCYSFLYEKMMSFKTQDNLIIDDLKKEKARMLSSIVASGSHLKQVGNYKEVKKMRESLYERFLEEEKTK